MFTILIGLISFCQEFIEFTPSESTNPTHVIQASNDTIVEFEILVPGVFATEMDSFQRIEIEDHSRMDSVGFPEIPVLSFLVAIPDCDDVNLEIELLDSIRFEDVHIYPAPEMVLDSNVAGVKYYREEFAYNENSYGINANYPGMIAQSVNKGAVRAQHCICIFVYPVQYNPVTKEIIAYSNIKLSLTFDNPSGSINNDVGIFNEMLGNSMINYGSNGLNASVSCGAGYSEQGSVQYDAILLDQKIGYPCDYLIITPNNFYNNTDILALATHRANFNGFDVVITNVGAIYNTFQNSDDDFEMIRNLIKNTYEDNNANHTFDGKLAYVNLFGDVVLENFPTDGIPTWSTGFDIYYTQLTVPDPYPDIMIGRCSADDAEQVENIVNKIINFEPGVLSYNTDMLTVVGNDYLSSNYLVQENSIFGIENHDNNFQFTKYSIITPEYFESGHAIPETWIPLEPFSDNTIVEALKYNPFYPNIDNRKMFLNFMGHGSKSDWWLDSSSGFSFSDLIPLSNYSIPFVLSATCETGAFWNYDNCMAEEFLCSDDVFGSIGFLGASITTPQSSGTLPSYFYYSFFNNYSYMIGEAIMEVKIAKYDVSYSSLGNWLDHYNLFGDPALNMKYENADIIYPDLVTKDFEITLQPNPIYLGDIVNIEAEIRNITKIDATNNFYVHCYIGEPGLPGTIEIGQYEINGIDGHQRKTAYFTWETQTYDPNIYEIYIYIDPENNITEENETNNINYKPTALYDFYGNFPVTSETNKNAHVIAFDLYNEYSGKEIIFGEGIFTIFGNPLNSNYDETIGNSCIANLANNENYQIIQIQKAPDPKIISTGNPTWSYDIDGSEYSPIVFDIDNDGLEEVLCFSADSPDDKLYCLDGDGTLRWMFDDLADPPDVNYIEILAGNFNGNNNSIILMNDEGTMLSIEENASGIPEIVYSYSIPNFISFSSNPVAADINKDGQVEIIIVYRSQILGENIYTLANYNAIDFSLNCSKIIDQQQFINPIISDLNNDGESEIIIGEHEIGLSIYNIDLELINHIQDNNIYDCDLVTGDINNNGNLDIICKIKTDDFYGIKGYDINGNQTFFKPVIGNYESCWLSDITNSNEFYYIYGVLDNLFVVNIPDVGADIGWPGQRGNVRNTGVYEQPAYFGENGETVYWMNTIVLSAEVDNIIPEGSTVIIKPGTKIKAHTNSSLIVNGTLIAEGTEKFPITFTADINSASEGYWQGITLSNNSSSSFEYIEIYDAEFGLLFEDFSDQKTEYCTFENNTVGIGAYSSSPVIKKCYFTNNGKAVASYSSGSPILTDLVLATHFENALINNDVGIYVNSGSFYIDEGYNDIYNEPATGYYIQSMTDGRFSAEHNYWGSTVVKDIKLRLSPSRDIDIEPICTSSNTTYKSTSGIEGGLLKDAYVEMAAENYGDAESIFKNIIADYPLSNAAYLAVSGLYTCYVNTNENWQNLETYFENQYSDTTNLMDKKLVFSYLNLSKRALGKYSEAITNYESKLLSNPTYNDSVFAVINIGNTYEEAGNYKSTLGQLSELVPVSRAKHVEKTVDLLLSLKLQDNKQTSISQKIEICEVFPNPVRDVVTLTFTNASNNRVFIKLYDVMGKLVYNQDLGVYGYGKQEIELNVDFLNPGVYYILLYSNQFYSEAEELIVK